MILLQENLAGIMASWVSAAAALAAIILSIVSMFQSKKIKELIEITKELSKQTEQLKNHTDILNKRYELERDTDLYNRIPNFQFRGNVNVGMGNGKYHYNFFLINMGASAHALHSRTPEDVNPVTISSSEIVPKHNTIDVKYLPSNPSRLNIQSGFHCDIYYSDDIGRLIYQTIKYLPETKPTISRPTLVKEDSIVS